LVRIHLKCRKPKDYADEPQTIGEHIKKRRLETGLTQAQAAARLGVSASALLHWETGKKLPLPRMLGQLTSFLGYDPFPAPATIPERLFNERQKRGWSIRAAARQVGVDPGTWGDWERGGLIFYLSHRTKLAQFLGLDLQRLDEEMRTRWNKKHRRLECCDS
jgi:transcriptional regulator with XRE-family HTH domain